MHLHDYFHISSIFIGDIIKFELDFLQFDFNETILFF